MTRGRLLYSFVLLLSVAYGQEDAAPGSAPPTPADGAAQMLPAASLSAVGSELTTLVVRTKVSARYPPEARPEYLQVRVLVKFQVSEAGDVESAEVVRGPVNTGRTVLDQAALDAAAKQWKFRPYMRYGRPVKVSTTLRFDFKLDTQIPEWGTRGLAPPRRSTPAPGGDRFKVS